MKVIHATKYYLPHQGGIESNIRDIAAGLIRRGAEVSVACANVPKTKRKEVADGVRVLRSRSLFTFSKDPFAPGIFLSLLREDYDVMHFHHPDPFNSIFAWLAAKMRRKPYVVTYHADIIREGFIGALAKAYQPFLDMLLGDAKKVFVTTSAYAKDSKTLNRGGIKEKIAVVHNFVDLQKFKPGDRDAALKELGLSELEKKKIILFLGRLVPYKGLEYLIEAFAEVKKKIPDAYLLIVGDGPLKEEIMEKAKNTGDARVLGRQEDNSQYYAACDVFALPSVTRQEAFGISLLEAMASGKACVTTDISGMPEVVGHTGVLAPPKDAKALASALAEVLEDSQRRKALGELARQRAETEFDGEKIVDGLKTHYEEAAAGFKTKKQIS
jgi:rhamnosyl/mannosyltransferase